MSIAPIMLMFKKCPTCKKKYRFNPDVGIGLHCPYCMGIDLSKVSGKTKGKK